MKITCHFEGVLLAEAVLLALMCPGAPSKPLILRPCLYVRALHPRCSRVSIIERLQPPDSAAAGQTAAAEAETRADDAGRRLLRAIYTPLEETAVGRQDTDR